MSCHCHFPRDEFKTNAFFLHILQFAILQSSQVLFLFIIFSLDSEAGIKKEKDGCKTVTRRTRELTRIVMILTAFRFYVSIYFT